MPIAAASALPDSELVLKFESLGDNCELGLVQRRVGVEPLGLLRFAGAPLRQLIKALDARFDGIADPEWIRIQPENDEYMVKLTKYDFVYHAEKKIGEADPDLLHGQQIRTVGFLARKLLDDLAHPTKIMVFRQNEPLTANDLIDLRVALAAHGPAILLWVQAAQPGHPPGSVVKVDDRLMVGYVSRLARREYVPDLDVASWLAMLRMAYRVHLGADRDAATAPARTEIVFGKAGNTAGCTGDGWSAPENGFTWAIGKRSVLTIPNPGPGSTFWLELDVKPFVAPPALPAQVLRVTVNGHLVHVFDPLARGVVGCTVPATAFDGRDAVEIAFDHPNAASPRAVAGEKDDRMLAVAFCSLSLTGH